MSVGGPLFDAHQLGLGATGNETWAAGVAHALELDGGDAPTYAVTEAAVLPSTVPLERTVQVAGSSARRLLVDLPRAVRRRRPSALVVQYTLPPFVRVPGVVAVHDLSFEDPASAQWIPPATRARYRLTIRASAHRAAVILTLTEHGRQDLVERYDLHPDRVLVASPGVDGALLAALAATPEARPAEPVVLCVGTVLPRKNLPIVAHAIAQLRRDGMPARLRLVGPLRDAGQAEVVEILRALPAHAVEVLGAVDVQALASAYRTSSVLAFPSRYEGFGLPVIEAMSAGLPVVSSSATCLPEVVGEGALLASPDSPEAWTEQLRKVLDGQGVRADLVARGRARAEAFSWTVTAAAVRQAVALAST